ncbi:GntR family transcriptional regulator [Pseudaminobacter salicylatoxidans]|uniref:GntR family transcriptional regulator n=1 Tax=Pseudaminobacter salicylatoxidans TaxID=93369 RepID=A0A316C4C4_PSESE|nr:GntR family transcriptional regulator [Pseudaminobacter salicylatoxidans]PWJ84408.1 GntR family transcriptional regulator [Pseudaminobacter salicylatoxidans]
MAEEQNSHTSSEQVLARLREVILSGELRPGEKLHQDRLAEMLGVSRTPLRTALTALTQSGLVVYEANRGFRVREFSFVDVLAAFRVRAEMEALACKLAAPRISEADIACLHEMVALGDRLIEDGTLQTERLPAYRQMNVDFHTTVLQASGNKWIENFIDQLHNVPLASDRLIMWHDYGVIRRSHDDHRRIATQLAARDGDRAAGIMYEHISFAADHLVEHLKRSPEDFIRVPVGDVDDIDPKPRSKTRRKKQS